MAGELTRQETELFYDISADIERYDPGIEEFNFIVKRAELFINDNGGMESLNYHPTIAQLNDQWEFYDHTATLTGKIYVLGNGIIDVDAEKWRGPLTDNRGTYYVVDGVPLISVGIIDVKYGSRDTVDQGGTVDQSVELGYGFNPEGIDSDIPMFFASPEDILHADYDMLSMDAVATNLRRVLPDEMEKLDKRIYKAGFDPMKLIKKLRKSIDEMQPYLVKNQELQQQLGRYVYERIELDSYWSYGVTIEGPSLYAEDDDPLSPITFDQPSLHYLKASGLSLEEHVEQSGRRVDLSLIFAVPTAATEGEGIDGRLFVPLSSIKGIFSTRPMGSIHDSYMAAIDEQARAAYSGDAEISLPETPPERKIHPRLMEYQRLEAFETLVATMKKKIAEVRRTRHSSSQDALFVASNLAKWFNEEALALNMEESDAIYVGGPGVAKANANLRTVQRSLHVEVDEENPIVSPPITADITGIFEGTLAEVDKYEEDDGTEFWLPAPKMTMMLKVIKTPLVSNNHTLLEAAIKSSATVRLDETTYIELPELERMRERNAALTALATAHEGSAGLRRVRAVEQAFFHESPDTWNEAGNILNHIRQLARSLKAHPDDTLLEAFRQQLLGRRVQVAGNTWFGNGRSDDHMNVGIINDMFMATLPDGSEEIVINVAGTTIGSTSPEPDTAALVILRTVSHLKF